MDSTYEINDDEFSVLFIFAILLEIRLLSAIRIHALNIVKMVEFANWMSLRYIQHVYAAVNGWAPNVTIHRLANIIVAIAFMAVQSMSVCMYRNGFFLYILKRFYSGKMV